MTRELIETSDGFIDSLIIDLGQVRNYTMFDILSEAFITLLVVIDPFGVLPAFVALTKADTVLRKKQIALKATVISAVILLIFAFIGDFVLEALHISEASFRIAGGILLLLTAIDMVIAKHSGLISTTRDEEVEAEHRDDISVFPLAIPLIAGPGALASLALLMRQSQGEISLQIGIIAALASVLIILYLCLSMSYFLSKLMGLTGANVMSRVFGIILAALAVQFIIDGLKISFAEQLIT